MTTKTDMTINLMLQLTISHTGTLVIILLCLQFNLRSLISCFSFLSFTIAGSLTIEIINNFIYSLNKQNNISTPDLNKASKHNRGKGNHSYKYNLLKDGCHPNDLMKIKIKECLVQAMDKNRTGIKHL